MHHFGLEEHNVQAVLFNQKIQCMEGALITQCESTKNIYNLYILGLSQRFFGTQSKKLDL